MIENYPNPLIRTLLNPTRCNITYKKFKGENTIYSSIVKNTEIQKLLKENIYYDNTVIEDLETLTKLKETQNKAEYNKLYKKVIGVGEFKINT